MTRAELHQLIDELPDASLPAVTSAIARAIHDPVAAILDNAPEDDEPVTDEDIAALEAAEREATRDGWIGLGEFRAEVKESRA